MAFDEGLAERIRDVLVKTPRITERRMFGGVAFLSDGHMFVGLIGDVLMARVGPEYYAAALERKYVREMDFTGKPMKGYVYVDPAGIAGDEELEEWVMRCRAFVKTLPPKHENEPVPKIRKAKRAKARSTAR
ncbi:RNA methyltransferase [Steroidobacter agaridevorans]|uniref:RNA methyltransferase n=1 Tax=Steroidobacter agaridevorans TaxID=2695856 RepID=A0A829YN67_9GAMM|nr:TfoX/Sxy family protein [Steroidobacter agaridevorans]GFE84351.1 RNA methyltransferase [Steroidobacter agaridevorans]